MPPPALSVHSLSVQFGGVKAVTNVSLEVFEHEILGLMGPNGAGKTTLFRLISGETCPDSGQVRFYDTDVTGKPLHEIASLGLVRTFQITELFDELTVLDNVLVGAHLSEPPSLFQSVFRRVDNVGARRSKIDYCMSLLELVGLERFADSDCRTLPHGHRKLLNIAIALGARPRCLLLDEPVAGMNEEEVSRTLQIIRDLRDGGTSIFIVEHNLNALNSIADRIIVLNFGQKIGEGTPAQIATDETVRAAYLGSGGDS